MNNLSFNMLIKTLTLIKESFLPFTVTNIIMF